MENANLFWEGGPACARPKADLLAEQVEAVALALGCHRALAELA